MLGTRAPLAAGSSPVGHVSCRPGSGGQGCEAQKRWQRRQRVAARSRLPNTAARGGRRAFSPRCSREIAKFHATESCTNSEMRRHLCSALGLVLLLAVLPLALSDAVCNFPRSVPFPPLPHNAKKDNSSIPFQACSWAVVLLGSYATHAPIAAARHVQCITCLLLSYLADGFFCFRPSTLSFCRNPSRGDR